MDEQTFKVLPVWSVCQNMSDTQTAGPALSTEVNKKCASGQTTSLSAAVAKQHTAEVTLVLEKL